MIDLGEKYNKLVEEEGWKEVLLYMAEEIEREISHQDRWHTYEDRVVKIEDKFISFQYAYGSTEMQEYPQDPISDIHEVEPVEETITRIVYKKIKEGKDG